MRPFLVLCLAAALTACADDAPAPAPPPPTPAAQTDGDGVLGLAALNPSLETFRAAIEGTALADTLASEGPFTVLAPSDAAFAAAGLDADADLEARLRGLVIPTRILAIDVFEAMEIETLGGTTVEVDAPSEGRVVIRAGGTTATVVEADLDAANGVIHIIDTVL